jgi:methionine-rich copper-binding protein CopC
MLSNWKNRGRQLAMITCLAVLFTLFGVHSAFAHAQLIKASPADKAKLQVAPEKLELWFNELLDESFNNIEVYPAGELKEKKHTNFAKADPVVDPKDRTHLTVSLSAMKPGEYIVDYRVLSRDGHTAPGRITFQVVESK